MGMLTVLPPELVTLLTWVMYWIGAIAITLVICIAGGHFMGQFMDFIKGH